MILTKSQIEQIKKIINQYYHAFIFRNIGPEYLSSEERKGLPENIPTTDHFKNAFIVGKTRGSTPGDEASKTYDQFLGEIFNRNLGTSNMDQQTIDFIKDRAAHYLQNLKNDTVEKIIGTIHDKNREEHMKTVGEVRTSLESAVRESRTVQELASELREKTGEIARNWERLVRTELATAHNQGAVNTIIERNREGGNTKEDILVYCQGPLDDATCLEVGTRVLTSNGYKKVEDLNKDDKVTNINNVHNVQGAIKNYSKVEYKNIVKKPGVEVELEDGSKIRCSADHPILIKYANKYWFWEAGKLSLDLNIEIPDLTNMSKSELSKMSRNIRSFCTKIDFHGDIWDFIQEYRDSICQRYSSGESMGSIAKDFYTAQGPGRRFIKAILELSQIPIQKNRHSKNNFFNKSYSDSEHQRVEDILDKNKEIVISDFKKGMSGLEISKKQNLSKYHVWEILRRAGFEISKMNRQHGPKSYWKNITREELKRRKEISRNNMLKNKNCVSSQQKQIFDMIKKSVDENAKVEERVGEMKVDIFIPKYNLVVEYDGGGHWLQSYIGNKTLGQIKQNDFARDEILKSKGYKILRIDSRDSRVPAKKDLLEKIEEFTRSINVFERWYL